MKKKEKENKEKKLFLNKKKLRLFLKLWADTQAEVEAQSTIPSAGKESGKESADTPNSAKLQSNGALNEVIK